MSKPSKPVYWLKTSTLMNPEDWTLEGVDIMSFKNHEEAVAFVDKLRKRKQRELDERN